ncbi:hypothetical protein [Chitinophaga barathri]|uniref:Uncharacterized protein n=1 Tax=Chitinophaga barathri TaxID=1647451 RepID=A0A3N4MC16_9BACT|nr:hypothetical protein [Chitinophaga barathri]RPD38987.1 hypothetical protein EG028_22885 [Chitinophaga barathri]
MTKKTKMAAIRLSVIALVIAGGLYFFHSFFSAFAPPEIKITKNCISTNRDFINGVSIEKIQVDLIGDKNHPVKYTVIYTTSCNIHHPIGRPPDPPNRIEFDKPGNYSWDEDTVKVRYIHDGLSRASLDTTNELWWLNKFGDHAICPIKFEREQWYFITMGDPQVTGIFFYIDKSGEEHQYFLHSGVSPI